MDIRYLLLALDELSETEKLQESESHILANQKVKDQNQNQQNFGI